MKNHRLFAHFLLLLILLGACGEDDEALPAEEAIVGTWRLYEIGYSPGSGYFVDTIPAEPPQTVTFARDGNFQVNGDELADWENFQRYRLLTDSSGDANQVMLEEDVVGNEITIPFTIQEDTLRLDPPCFEGCHRAFVRLR